MDGMKESWFNMKRIHQADKTVLFMDHPEYGETPLRCYLPEASDTLQPVKVVSQYDISIASFIPQR